MKLREAYFDMMDFLIPFEGAKIKAFTSVDFEIPPVAFRGSPVYIVPALKPTSISSSGDIPNAGNILYGGDRATADGEKGAVVKRIDRFLYMFFKRMDSQGYDPSWLEVCQHHQVVRRRFDGEGGARLWEDSY
jgi:hypothetical protein